MYAARQALQTLAGDIVMDSGEWWRSVCQGLGQGEAAQSLREARPPKIATAGFNEPKTQLSGEEEG